MQYGSEAVSDIGPRRDRPRLVGLTRGNPDSPYSNSGVNYPLLKAVGRRYLLVGKFDVGPTAAQRVALGSRTFNPSVYRWTQRYFKHPIVFDVQSRNAQASLAKLGQPIDLAFQIHGLFRTRGVPYTVYVDNTYRDSELNWPEWNQLRGRALERWYADEFDLYQQARHLFVMSEHAAGWLRDHYHVPDSRITVVGAGANFETLPEITITEKTREGTILFIAREWKRKGGPLLIEAFKRVQAKLPNIRLLVVGTKDAPSMPGVEARPSVSRSEIVQLFATASVFCLPSLFDPFPGVLSEAMAYGLSCVATSVCGIPEIIRNGETGFVVPPGDAEALAAALVALLSNPALAAKFGAAGRHRVEQHLNWDSVVGRMAPVLDRLAEG